jgi:hypothetical protein
MRPDSRFTNDSQRMNESRRVTRRRNLCRSDDLTSAYVGIQALLEVAKENEIKLAGNSSGKGNLITETIVRASSKMTKKGIEQSQDKLRFQLKEAEAGWSLSLVHKGKVGRKFPGLQVTEKFGSGESENQVQDKLQVRLEGLEAGQEQPLVHRSEEK